MKPKKDWDGWLGACLIAPFALWGPCSVYLARVMAHLRGTDNFLYLAAAYGGCSRLAVAGYLGILRAIQVSGAGEKMNRYKSYALALLILCAGWSLVSLLIFVL